MTSLGETFGGREGDGRRRLYLGTGLLLAGAAVALPGLLNVVVGALSAAGLADAAALQVGVGVVGVALPAGFVALLAPLDADARLRYAGGAGVTLAVLAVGLFLFTVPPGALPGGVPLAVFGLYALGAGVAVASPVVAAAAAFADGASSARTAAATRFRRSDRRPSAPGQVPADGGSEDDDLRFPLDEE